MKARSSGAASADAQKLDNAKSYRQLQRLHGKGESSRESFIRTHRSKA
jgi:hypothetical protein